MNTGRGKKGRNCVCVCVWEQGEQGGELICQKPPSPRGRKLAGEWAEKGDGQRGKDMELGSGSAKIESLWRRHPRWVPGWG